MKVELVDYMGDDLSVVNAARVSFDKQSEYLGEKDKKLINYLAKHGHWTPFAHTAISLRIKAPIFVARQLGKHQVGLVWNEVSRRYVDETPEFYTPEVWRAKAENVKQGSSEESVEVDYSSYYLELVKFCSEVYDQMLGDNVCPEQARMVLPQSMYTTWIWTGSLMAFARVCNLRLDPHTQKETREVAQMISDVIKPLYPESWRALTNESSSSL